MSIYVRPFRKSDLSAFKPLEPDIDRFDDELAQAIEDSDLSVTGVKRDGTIVGCGGIHPSENQKGHGVLWLRLSDYSKKHKLETLRWLKEGLNILQDIHDFIQLDAYVKCNFAQSIKLMKYLGFAQVQTITENKQKWCVFSKRTKE